MRIPGWLAFLVFVPLQIFVAVKLWQSYGFWWLLLIGIVLAILGNRASSVHWLQHALFPNWAQRRESRRHVYQGVLFLIAAIAWLLVVTPQPWIASGLNAWLQRGHPWLALAALITLVKSTLR